MQHHSHVPRPPPSHIRHLHPPQHSMPMHTNTPSGGVGRVGGGSGVVGMPAIGKPAIQSVPAQHQIAPISVQQNTALVQPTATALTAMRLPHQHTSTHMQKLRQQHQNLNHNNNNNNINNNTNNNNNNNSHHNNPNKASFQYHMHHMSYNSNNINNNNNNQGNIPQLQQQQQQQTQHTGAPQQQPKSPLLQRNGAQPPPPPSLHSHQQQQQQQQQQVQHYNSSASAIQPHNMAQLKSLLPNHSSTANLSPHPSTNNLKPHSSSSSYTVSSGGRGNQTYQQQAHFPYGRGKYHNNNNNNNYGATAAASGAPKKTNLQNSSRSWRSQVPPTKRASADKAADVAASTITEEEAVEKDALDTANSSTSSGSNAASAGSGHTESAVCSDGAKAGGAKSAKGAVEGEHTTGVEVLEEDDSNKENTCVSVKESETSELPISIKSKNRNNTSSYSNILPNEESNSNAKHAKEKTPMCLVNELARFNKIIHQYRLTGEKGPAHCKRFAVTLKLGDEEYYAEGFKIKKAQHLAAAEAIEKTKYKHPVPKVTRRESETNTSRHQITPTVELNALAMKLGQQTYYLFDPRQMTASPDGATAVSDSTTLAPYHSGGAPGAVAASAGGPMLPPPPIPSSSSHAHPYGRMMEPAYMRRNGGYPLPPPHMPPPRFTCGYPPRYRYQMPPPPLSHHNMYRAPPLHPHSLSHTHGGYMPALPLAPHTPCRITLIVGKQKFIGIGRTMQQAKHDAAARALEALKSQASAQLNETLSDSVEENDNKSPISLVHEFGIKRNLPVTFKGMREDGPAHMKTFVTACIVGNMMTEGTGNGKKISKKRAAEKMLEELKKLPPITPTKSPVKRIKVKTPGKGAPAAGGDVCAANVGGAERRKRGSASIKERSTDTDAEGADNPIARLIQLQQSRKEKEPTFELIAKNGNEHSRRREFIVEVTASSLVARGTGNSKKLAKRNAAQNLLLAIETECHGSVAATVTAKAAATDVVDGEKVGDTDAVAVTSTAVNGGETQPSTTVANATATEPVMGTVTGVTETGNVPVITTPAGPVPGILILRQNKKNALRKKELTTNTTTSTAATATTTATAETKLDELLPAIPIEQPPAAAEDAKEDAVGSAIEADAESNNSNNSAGGCAAATGSTLHMKEQLLYLAKLMGFEVNFNDYPKGNHNEFLTIVTLSTNPPQICHGVGTSADESKNDAARNALKILSELGLNNANSN